MINKVPGAGSCSRAGLLWCIWLVQPFCTAASVKCSCNQSPRGWASDCAYTEMHACVWCVQRITAIWDVLVSILCFWINAPAVWLMASCRTSMQEPILWKYSTFQSNPNRTVFSWTHIIKSYDDCRQMCWSVLWYRKFSNKGAGRGGEALGGALIRKKTFSPSNGFLQNEKRSIFGWDMSKNVKRLSSLWGQRGGGALIGGGALNGEFTVVLTSPPQ